MSHFFIKYRGPTGRSEFLTFVLKGKNFEVKSEFLVLKCPYCQKMTQKGSNDKQ